MKTYTCDRCQCPLDHSTRHYQVRVVMRYHTHQTLSPAGVEPIDLCLDCVLAYRRVVEAWRDGRVNVEGPTIEGPTIESPVIEGSLDGRPVDDCPADVLLSTTSTREGRETCPTPTPTPTHCLSLRLSLPESTPHDS